MNIFQRMQAGEDVDTRPEPPTVMTHHVDIGDNVIAVICPYCGRKHFHGIGDFEGGFLEGDPTHRAIHCLNKAPDNRGYNIVLSEANRLELLAKIAEQRKIRKRQTECNMQVARPRCTGKTCRNCEILNRVEALLTRPKKESVENAR